jgi:hypothetical protein
METLTLAAELMEKKAEVAEQVVEASPPFSQVESPSTVDPVRTGAGGRGVAQKSPVEVSSATKEADEKEVEESEDASEATEEGNIMCV